MWTTEFQSYDKHHVVHHVIRHVVYHNIMSASKPAGGLSLLSALHPSGPSHLCLSTFPAIHTLQAARLWYADGQSSLGPNISLSFLVYGPLRTKNKKFTPGAFAHFGAHCTPAPPLKIVLGPGALPFCGLKLCIKDSGGRT